MHFYSSFDLNLFFIALFICVTLYHFGMEKQNPSDFSLIRVSDLEKTVSGASGDSGACGHFV